jgi:hypothetical protein
VLYPRLVFSLELVVGEYVSTEIIIGGILASDKVQEFCDLINGSGLSREFEGPNVDINSAEDIVNILDDDHYLHLCEMEANYGVLGIEKDLRQLGLSFCKLVDGKSGFDPVFDIVLNQSPGEDYNQSPGEDYSVTLSHSFFYDMWNMVDLYRSGDTEEAEDIARQYFPEADWKMPPFEVKDVQV